MLNYYTIKARGNTYLVISTLYNRLSEYVLTLISTLQNSPVTYYQLSTAHIRSDNYYIPLYKPCISTERAYFKNSLDAIHIPFSFIRKLFPDSILLYSPRELCSHLKSALVRKNLYSKLSNTTIKTSISSLTCSLPVEETLKYLTREEQELYNLLTSNANIVTNHIIINP